MLVVSLSFVACGDDDDESVNSDPGPNSEQQKDTSKVNHSDTTKVNPDDSNAQEVAKLELTGNKSDAKTGIVTITGKNLSFIKGMKIGDVELMYSIDGESLTFSAAGLPSGEQTILVTSEDANGKSTTEEYKVTIPSPVVEIIDAKNFRVKANENGSITIIGDVASNAILKIFEIQDANGMTVYDFLRDNERVAESNRKVDAGAWVSNTLLFNLQNIESNQLPVGIYALVIKTRNSKKYEVQLGEVLDYKIGSSKSESGAYLSIANNRQMRMDEAKSCSVDVIAVSSEDGYSVMGLKPASHARDAQIAENASKVTLFDEYGQIGDVVGEGGVIITDYGYICKIVSIINDASGNAVVKMITLRDKYQPLPNLPIEENIPETPADDPNSDISHTFGDLEGSWMWETTEGDDNLGEKFDISISKKLDTKFVINNFGNFCESIVVSVSGTSLSFAGRLCDGDVVIYNGTGSIINDGEEMTISYYLYVKSDEETEHYSAILHKGKLPSKK